MRMHVPRVMIIAFGAALLGASMGRAQSAPFSDFTKLSKNELAELQGKLTWVGPQREMVPSVAYATAGTAVDPSVFASTRTPGFDYRNDAMKPETFTASATELAAVLKGLDAVAGVSGGGTPPSDGVLSVAFATGGKVFETVVNRPDAAAVMSTMLDATPMNATALGVLTGLACSGNVIGPATATPASVTVTRSGIRRNRATGRFVQTVTIENTSGAPLGGPLSIALGGLPGSVVVVNKAGTTCQLTPPGRPFVNVSGALAAGARADVVLEFDNPDDLELTYTAAVYNGGGPR